MFNILYSEWRQRIQTSLYLSRFFCTLEIACFLACACPVEMPWRKYLARHSFRFRYLEGVSDEYHYRRHPFLMWLKPHATCGKTKLSTEELAGLPSQKAQRHFIRSRGAEFWQYPPFPSVIHKLEFLSWLHPFKQFLRLRMKEPTLLLKYTY